MPLGAPLTPEEQTVLASVHIVSSVNGSMPKLDTGKHVLNLAIYNFMGLAGNETIEMRAIETLQKYGVGGCGTVGTPLCCQCTFIMMKGLTLQTSTWTLNSAIESSPDCCVGLTMRPASCEHRRSACRS